MSTYKFGALCYINSYNLGDNIQTLAAIQHLPKIDYWIDRDTGNLYDTNGNSIILNDTNIKIKCIYNGWFDGQYCNFPPPEYIEPLFISFHINETSHKSDKRYDVLDPKINFKSISLNNKYFSKYGSVGCRDYHTFYLLRKNNIDCYFSACLTLTLKKENYFVSYSDKILIIDAHIDCPDIFDKYMPENIKLAMNKSDSSIEFMTQALEGVLPNNAEKLLLATELLQKIAGAKLIITSRLHSTLPAIAFGIPVIFMNLNLSDVRFDGLICGPCIDINGPHYNNIISSGLENISQKNKHINIKDIDIIKNIEIINNFKN